MAWPDHLFMRIRFIGGCPPGAAGTGRARGLPFADEITFAGLRREPYPGVSSADIFVPASHVDPAPLVLSGTRAVTCAMIAARVEGIPERAGQGRRVFPSSRRPGRDRVRGERGRDRCR